MRKKLIIVLAVLVGIVGTFCAVVASRPSEFRVQRTITIAAPPAEVFPHVNDFHSWEAWSPWAKLDPNSKVAFEGPESGKGAIFKWSGNSQVGEGVMTLTESHPNTLIQINLEFIKPFAGTNTAEFTFRPMGKKIPQAEPATDAKEVAEKDAEKGEEEQTEVTWSMFGPSNFMHKAICMFMDMDKMVGGQFEQGLASMKAEVEAAHRHKDQEHEGSKKETPEH